ncbi:hypothetical protein MTO96_030102 [Rhipicephalus appendiculatus]
MPANVDLKHARRRKFKAKERLSFGSSSSGSSSLPSDMKADLPDLFARLEVQQKNVPRCDDSEDRTKGAASNRWSTEEIVPTAEKAGSEIHAAGSSPYSTKTVDGKEWEDGRWKSTTDASSFNFEGNLISSEEESDALTDTDPVDIARLLRKALKNGPFFEEELLSAQSPSQVQYLIYAYGILTAFMDLPPGFEPAQECRYIFVYYEDLDVEECDRCGSSHIQDDPNHERFSRGSSDGVHQHANDGKPKRERRSSSSSTYCELFVDEQAEEDRHGLKDASCQVPRSPPCYSRGVQAVQETSDADAQTKSQGGEVQQLKTEQLLKSLQAVTPQHGIMLKNRTATKEQKAGTRTGQVTRSARHSHDYRCARGTYQPVSETSCLCLQLNRGPGHCS